jgi:hypothetical protein
MVLQVGPQPVLGAFGCVLGSQVTKFTVLVRPKDLFVLILSWEARFPWTNGIHQSWAVLAVFWVARPQNPLPV